MSRPSGEYDNGLRQPIIIDDPSDIYDAIDDPQYPLSKAALEKIKYLAEFRLQEIAAKEQTIPPLFFC